MFMNAVMLQRRVTQPCARPQLQSVSKINVSDEKRLEEDVCRRNFVERKGRSARAHNRTPTWPILYGH